MTNPDDSIVRALDVLMLAPAWVAGVGVDLVNVETTERLLSSSISSTFLDTAWTPVEQRDAADDPERLAARWAAKEAVMKALGRGLGDVDPLDVEIVSDADGVPRARLRGSAARTAEHAGVETVHISMSHEEGWAAAFAVAERRSRDQFSKGSRKGPGRGQAHGC